MKKITLLTLILVISIFGLTEGAHASLVTFDSILTFPPETIPDGTTGFSYSHNILVLGFVPATDTLSTAMLNLDLTSNQSSRMVSVILDGTLSGNYLVTDPAWNTLAVNVAWLQTDGILNVVLTKTSGTGNAKLYRSELTASGDRVVPDDDGGGATKGDGAVPEPASMLLFSIGALGMGIIRKKK